MSEKSHTKFQQTSSFTDFAPIFVATPSPLWRAFWPCLIIAGLLRIFIGVSGDWIVRPDELMQYLEQAHRLVFGYGQVPWEYRLGSRSWLLPAIPAIPLWLCDIAGIAHPTIYIPAVKVWNSLLSLLIPAGMYVFVRRINNEMAARMALLFGCFWHEFIVLASHSFSEQYSSIMFFLALILISPTASKTRLLLAGIALGLTIALRAPYLLTVGILGLALLTVYSPRRWLWMVIGGIIALLLWGGVDFLTWGRWWHSIRLYTDIILFYDILGKMGFDAMSPPHQYLIFLANSSFGLYALIIIALWRWRQRWLLWALLGGTFGFHTLLSNKEYTNIFIIIPLAWMLIASGAVTIGEWIARINSSRQLRASIAKIIGVLPMLATVATFIMGIPNWSKNYNGDYLTTNTLFLHSEVRMEIARYLSKLPSGSVQSVQWWGPFSLYSTGSYYYLHHQIPILYPNLITQHTWLLEKIGQPYIASHVIAPTQLNIPGYTRHQEFRELAIFVANVPPPTDWISKFSTDLDNPLWAPLESVARQAGVYLPKTRKTFLYDDAANNSSN